jgi:hypothetical protein
LSRELVTMCHFWDPDFVILTPSLRYSAFAIGFIILHDILELDLASLLENVHDIEQ